MHVVGGGGRRERRGEQEKELLWSALKRYIYETDVD